LLLRQTAEAIVKRDDVCFICHGDITIIHLRESEPSDEHVAYWSGISFNNMANLSPTQIVATLKSAPAFTAGMATASAMPTADSSDIYEELESTVFGKDGLTDPETALVPLEEGAIAPREFSVAIEDSLVRPEEEDPTNPEKIFVVFNELPVMLELDITTKNPADHYKTLPPSPTSSSLNSDSHSEEWNDCSETSEDESSSTDNEKPNSGFSLCEITPPPTALATRRGFPSHVSMNAPIRSTCLVGGRFDKEIEFFKRHEARYPASRSPSSYRSHRSNTKKFIEGMLPSAVTFEQMSDVTLVSRNEAESEIMIRPKTIAKEAATSPRKDQRGAEKGVLEVGKLPTLIPELDSKMYTPIEKISCLYGQTSDPVEEFRSPVESIEPEIHVSRGNILNHAATPPAEHAVFVFTELKALSDEHKSGASVAPPATAVCNRELRLLQKNEIQEQQGNYSPDTIKFLNKIKEDGWSTESKKDKAMMIWLKSGRSRKTTRPEQAVSSFGTVCNAPRNKLEREEVERDKRQKQIDKELKKALDMNSRSGKKMRKIIDPSAQNRLSTPDYPHLKVLEAQKEELAIPFAARGATHQTPISDCSIITTLSDKAQPTSALTGPTKPGYLKATKSSEARQRDRFLPARQYSNRPHLNRQHNDHTLLISNWPNHDTLSFRRRGP
jgi:hypothetical protein